MFLVSRPHCPRQASQGDQDSTAVKTCTYACSQGPDRKKTYGVEPAAEAT